MKKRRPWKKQKRCYRKGRLKDRRRSAKEDVAEQWQKDKSKITNNPLKSME